MPPAAAFATVIRSRDSRSFDWITNAPALPVCVLAIIRGVFQGVSLARSRCAGKRFGSPACRAASTTASTKSRPAASPGAGSSTRITLGRQVRISRTKFP